MKFFTLLFSSLLILPFSLLAQNSAKEEALYRINESTISGPLEFLSSDWMEGRNTGEKGAYMASDYIASMFKAYGLEPGGDYPLIRRRGQTRTEKNRSYFQNFNLLEYRTGDDAYVALITGGPENRQELVLDANVDYSISAGTRAVNLEGNLVFVGYGFKAEGYDDFQGMDVANKIIIRMPGFPGHLNPESKAFQKFAGEGGPYAAYMIEQQKDQIAFEAGAAGVIELNMAGSGLSISPDNLPFRYNEANWEGTEPFRATPRTRLTAPENISGSLTRINLAPAILELILKNSGIDPVAFEEQAEQKMVPASSTLKGKKLSVRTTVISKLIQVRNVVGVLEGKQKDTCLVIGAHFDHLGQVRHVIYNGADDNASGTVGVMTIAKAMVESGVTPEYTLVFCAWTGEEKGLIGSRYFADHPLISQIKCYLNYDMISRVALDDPQKNKCDFQYTSTVPLLRELTEQHVKEYSINLDIAYNGSPKPRGGSDFSSFSAKDIPIFLLHGKFTPDYHQFTDHADKADLTYMRDIIRLGYLNIFELSTKTW